MYKSNTTLSYLYTEKKSNSMKKCRISIWSNKMEGFFLYQRTNTINCKKKTTRNRFYLRRIVVYNNHKNVGIYGVHGAHRTKYK